jgi:3-mercaptopyruvate sulfurtransferase SseA
MTIEERLAKAEETIRKAQEILFAYGANNEASAHPWWAVVKDAGLGRMVILDGVFFSRERATELLEARRYEYGPKAYVYCFSGHRSEHYRELRNVLNV